MTDDLEWVAEINKICTDTFGADLVHFAAGVKFGMITQDELQEIVDTVNHIAECKGRA